VVPGDDKEVNLEESNAPKQLETND
jgi:hypothetical protein